MSLFKNIQGLEKIQSIELHIQITNLKKLELLYFHLLQKTRNIEFGNPLFSGKLKNFEVNNPMHITIIYNPCLQHHPFLCTF